jgi:hypothetical protein
MELIFLLIIIVLLIVYLNKKETFNNKCNCPYNTVCLDAERSFESLGKSWCTHAYFNEQDESYDLSDENKKSSNKCVYGSSRISGKKSYESPSKAFCN